MQNPRLFTHRKILGSILGALAVSLASGTYAAVTDIATAPLASSSTLNVLPNILFTLDDSGSMAWDYLPDYVDDSNACKTGSTGSSNCSAGDPPYYAAQFNGVYYNPAIRYAPALNSDGSSKTSYGSPWTSVKVDAFSSSSSTINLTINFPERRYCNSAGTVCKRNGIDTPNPFEYRGVDPGSTYGYPDATYKVLSSINGNPFYYTISPKEYCSDANLTTCVAATASAGLDTYPAPVRFCNSAANASAAAPVSGGSKCQAKYTSTYKYPRYGKFTRTDIKPTVTSYPKAVARTDCSGTTCTYANEMTNFANWYAYSRTRMQMMKTATGLAFAAIDDRFRVGLVTINPSTPVSSSKYLAIDTFTPSHKANWYSKLYSQSSNSGTPLRTALSRAGRHFAGKADGINAGMTPDPVQHSCQQNFHILTTDGYWNGAGGQKLNGAAMDNQDSNSTTAPRPFYDGPSGTTTADTLADAAYYYYQNDLRATGSIGALGVEVAKDNVPTSDKDKANWQHMTTFTLGLVDGLMSWKNDYESADGDYRNILNGSSGCSWAAGTCNWPKPVADTLTALDDLWHAAVNGRGKYFNARDPATLSSGLNEAITSLETRNAAGAAAATSTPNITPSDRSIFKSSYTTVDWYGTIEMQLIDVTTGAVLPGVVWNARDLLDGRVGNGDDSRTIHTFDSGAPNGIKPFLYDQLTSSEQNYFRDKCSPSTNLTQCALLSAALLTRANDGINMVNYLRGQKGYETSIFRARKHTLGDTVNAVPVYVATPSRSFADTVTPTYADWKVSTDIAGRKGMLYVGSNDGMLHAFEGNSGNELWAYVPKMIMPNLYKLAEERYAGKHTYFVDGTPVEMDVHDGSAWRTILVSGLNSGGRGFFALDVTNPNAPQGLWEFCHTNALCAQNDSDMGYSYAKPIITKRASDARWVVMVTSGYNNVSPGDGKGYLYVLDAFSGAMLEKIATNVGTTTTPSGLGKISAWADNFNVDNTSKVVYGGDMEGNIWRFDMTSSPTSVMKLGRATDATGKGQPITTAPELGLVNRTHHAVFVGTGRYLGVKDLSDPATQAPAGTSAWRQSIYAIKDSGTVLGDLRNAGLIEQQILGVTGTETTRSITQNPVNWNTDNGWYIDLPLTTGDDGAQEAERVTVDPQLILGTLLIAGNVPGGGACAAGGEGWFYQFDFNTGSFVSSSPGEVVATKQTGALIVGFVVYQLPGGSVVGQVQQSNTGMIQTPISIGGQGTGRRVSWRELTQ